MKRKILILLAVLLISILLLEAINLSVEAKYKLKHKGKKHVYPFEVKDQLIFKTGEDQAYDICEYQGYLYVVCAGSTPCRIVKIEVATFKEIGSIELLAADGRGVGITAYEGYVYVACTTSPARVVRINVSTFQRVDALILGVTEEIDWLIGHPIILVQAFLGTPYLYVGLTENPGSRAGVARINLNTFTETLGSPLWTTEDLCHSIVISGQYLYVGAYGTNTIVRVDLPTFTQVATLAMLPFNLEHSIEIVGNYLYAYGSTLIGVNLVDGIAKVNLATFTLETEARIDLRVLYDSYCIKANKDYLYVMSQAWADARICRIELDAWPTYDTKIFGEQYTDGSATAGLQGAVIYGAYLYVCSYSSPGRVLKVLLPESFETTMSKQETNQGDPPHGFTRMRVLHRVTKIVPWIV